MTSTYEFIDGEKANYPIVKMCQWLDVSTSGYYHWRSRPLSATTRRREYLKELITHIFQRSDSVYGYRRVHAQLLRQGAQASPELVRALMIELDLVACQPKPRQWSLTDGDKNPMIPDLVQRDFTATRPGEKMVGDITYIPTWEGFLYLATVIDCSTKAVIGYAMADHYKTSLIEAALKSAVGNYQVHSKAVFHSDRGSNYTSHEFGKIMKKLDVRRSVGRTGICYDNAMAESFFAALKNERVHRTEYPTREHARRDITRYIEFFYNRERLHSGLGYRTPHETLFEYQNTRTQT